MEVKVYNAFDELPESYAEFFQIAERNNFFDGLLWYKALSETLLEPQESLRFYGVEDDGADASPIGLMIARVSGDQGPEGNKRCLSSFETVYSIQGGPIVRPSIDNQREVWRVLFDVVRSEAPRWDEVNLKLINHDSAAFQEIVEELRAIGMVVEPYFQFGNWYEDLEEPSFANYVAGRGKTVRETLRWKSRKLERTGRLRIELVTDESGLDEAINAYQAVYEASWKQEEGNPAFIQRLIRDCAAKGYLRLGNLYLDDKPVATQLSIACSGKAIMYKTAYDETVPRNLSIGGILTLHMMRHLLDVDKVNVVDFGLGDEAYKKSWLSKRRERWGIKAYNTRTMRGALAGSAARGRHFAKAIARKMPERLKGSQGG